MTTARVIERIGTLTDAQKALLAKQLKQWLEQVEVIQSLPLAAKIEGVPLTDAQQRLFVMRAQPEGSVCNNVAQRISFSGPLDVELMVKSIQLVAARHPAFSTRVQSRGAQALQVLDRRMAVQVERRDLSACAAPAAQLDALSGELARTSFELDGGQMLRLLIATLAKDQHVLLFVTHNLVFDAWSYVAFIEELKQCYNHARGQAGALAAVPEVDYFDYAAWRHQYKHTRKFRDGLEAWHQRLDFRHGDDLRLDRPRGAQREYRGARVPFELSPAVRDQLTQIGKARGATRFMTMLAAIESFLARRMGMRNFCIGTINSNRAQKQVEQVIGYFLNLTPIPARVDPGQDDFAKVIDQAKSEALASMEGAGIYFEEIVAGSEGGFDAGRNPYFDVLFAFENVPEDASGFDGLAHRFEDLDKGSARYDLTISLYDEADRFHGWMEYNAALFERATVEALARDFAAWLGSVSERPHVLLDKLGAGA